MRVSNFKVAAAVLMIIGFLGVSSILSPAYSDTHESQVVALQATQEDNNNEDESSDSDVVLVLIIAIVLLIVFIATFPFSEDQRRPRESKKAREWREAEARASTERYFSQFKDEKGNWLPNDHEVWQKQRPRY